MKTITTLLFSALTGIALNAQGIRLVVDGGNQSDTLHIRFTTGATVGYDNGLDQVASPVSGNGHNYVFENNGSTKLHLDQIQPAGANNVVPVSVFTQTQGYSNFKLEADPSLPSNTLFVLEDINGGQLIPLTPGVPVQQFLLQNAVNDPASYLLHIFPAPQIATAATHCSLSNDGTIQIHFGQSHNWTANFYDSGSSLILSVLVSGSDTTLPVFYADNYTVGFSTGTMDFYTANANVAQAPPIDATFDLTSDSIYTGTLVPVVNYASSGNGNSYSWNFGDGSPVTTGYQPYYQYTVAGSYEITQTVTSAGGCVDSFSVKVDVYPGVTTGISEAGWHDPQFTVNGTTLEISKISKGDAIAIFTVDGRLVQNVKANNDEISLTLPGNQLYVVQLVSGSQTISKKVYINGL